MLKNAWRIFPVLRNTSIFSMFELISKTLYGYYTTFVFSECKRNFTNSSKSANQAGILLFFRTSKFFLTIEKTCYAQIMSLQLIATGTLPGSVCPDSRLVITYFLRCFLLRMRNGPENSQLDDALEKLFARVVAETDYSPRFDALPFYFSRDCGEEKQIRSLKYHAEKKTLAKLLLKNSGKLNMRINVKVCEDCQSFLSHASSMLGRTIRVTEPSKVHSFNSGNFSRDISLH